MDESEKIPSYKIFIHPMDLMELKRDIWNDAPVPAQLTIEGKKLEVDISFRGSHIRDYRKKSYQIAFYKPKSFNGIKLFHLNAEYKDPSLIRNKLSFDFFSEIGCLAPRSRHVLLTRNGVSEGVYLEIESVDENFLSKRNLSQGSIFYAIDGDANFSLMSDLDKETKKSLELGYQRKWGEEKDDDYLQEMIFKVNTISREGFEQEILSYINVEQYFCWIAGVILTQNYDGFVHNYALYRSNETGLFEVIPWDYDATWGRDVNGKIMDPGYVPIEGYNTLTARLLDVSKYRNMYRDKLKDIMNNQFTSEFMKPRIEELHERIRPFVLKDPYVKDRIRQFDEEPKQMIEFIEGRRSYLLNRLYRLD